MGHDVLGFSEIDRTQVARVGGKGANLGSCRRSGASGYRRGQG